ncbi:MAG: hypothetical protein AB4050_00760 [Synechococcus sp.]
MVCLGIASDRKWSRVEFAIARACRHPVLWQIIITVCLWMTAFAHLLWGDAGNGEERSYTGGGFCLLRRWLCRLGNISSPDAAPLFSPIGISADRIGMSAALEATASSPFAQLA